MPKVRAQTKPSQKQVEIAAPQKTVFRRQSFSKAAVEYFDALALGYEERTQKGRFYVDHVIEFLSGIVTPGKKVLLIGPLSHRILPALQPSTGVGLCISEELKKLFTLKTVAENPRCFSHLSYVTALPEDYQPQEKYDYVIVLNMVDLCDDVFLLADSVKRFTHSESRVIFTMLNPLWHSFIRAASFLKIRIPDFNRNLVASRLLAGALEIKSFRVMGVFKRLLIPREIPVLSWLFNRILAKLPLFNPLCFTQYVVATPESPTTNIRPSCSVIIPCYNEEGNVAECIQRVPQMGAWTEIVVVDDGSHDRTLEIAENLAAMRSDLRVVTYGKNRGKGLAVLEGMQQSRGDIMMILDADMTVPPEELPEFYEAVATKAADFANGTRFMYPMEKEAMRFANYLGNLLFSKLVEIIVGTPYSDTLCGTKAMRRADFESFKIEDRAWGDFDLIFHAARMKLRCRQIPVHYKSRVAGESKMKAFQAGIAFLKLCLRKWSELP